MPTWFYNRPIERVDPTEKKVADVFDRLQGSWYIRWGYFYRDGRANGRADREGDFILLGPDGRVLVVEVKSGQNRHFVLTGEWEHGSDNPMIQLNDEWKAAISALEDAYDGKIPFVGKALCLPHVNLVEQERLAAEFSREMLIFGKDLDDFPAWWERHMAPHPTYCADPSKAFHAVFAKGLKPAAVQMFLRQSDLLFDRFKASEMEILLMLRNNRQWLVEGGVGTGKTFLALQQARWLAEEGAGRRVLFLSYNLLLTDHLISLAERLTLKRGSVEVRSWQDLMGEIIAREGLTLEIPKSKTAMTKYFQEELPAYVRMAFEGGKVASVYDALVVDEAQDHDTCIGENGSREAAGWWDWYFALLKEGASAPMALFYDPAQRPFFRTPERFDPDRIRSRLSQAAHIKLRKTLRYTVPIFRFLSGLRAPGTEALASGLHPHDALPAGPQVVRLKDDGIGTAGAVEQILLDWKAKGLCKPSDVVLIGVRRLLKESSLGAADRVAGLELTDYNASVHGKLTYIGAHRSKGMDFLGVILIDFPPFEQFAADPEAMDLQEAYFLGASRTRQLLGIVEAGSIAKEG